MIHDAGAALSEGPVITDRTILEAQAISPEISGRVRKVNLAKSFQKLGLLVEQSSGLHVQPCFNTTFQLFRVRLAFDQNISLFMRGARPPSAARF